MPKRLPIVATTAMAAILSIPATYAVQRAYEVVFKHEPNPATVVWSAHIAMFWRLNIGFFVAGMVAFPAYMGARADLARTLRVVYVGSLIVAGMIGAQGLLMP